MSINIKILNILKKSKELGKNKLQVQNIDHLLGRRGEKEFIGNKLFDKLQELLNDELIEYKITFYSITSKGLAYLEQNSEE